MKDKRFIRALIVFLIVVAIICCFPYWFVSGSLINFSNSGQIGDTIGGIMGPFIAIVASALTFLAFWVQYEANQMQRKQFASQNIDQLFFRLMDSQNSRIINSSFVIDEKDIASYQLMEHLVKEFYSQIRFECRLLTRKLIVEKYNDLPGLYYHKMFKAGGIPSDRYELEQITFIETMYLYDVNERWEHIKNYFGSLRGESPEQIDALESIGSIAFYNVDFEDRQIIYNSAFQTLERKYGSFLDGYFKGGEYISDIIENADNRTLYLQYFISQMTKYEKILNFYYIASGKSSSKYLKFIENNKILDGMFEFNSLLTDLPSAEQIEAELKFIFNR
jgi:hypothetical protein